MSTYLIQLWLYVEEWFASYEMVRNPGTCDKCEDFEACSAVSAWRDAKSQCCYEVCGWSFISQASGQCADPFITCTPHTQISLLGRQETFQRKDPFENACNFCEQCRTGFYNPVGPDQKCHLGKFPDRLTGCQFRPPNGKFPCFMLRTKLTLQPAITLGYCRLQKP